MTPRTRDWGALVAFLIFLSGGVFAWGGVSQSVTDLRAEVRRKADQAIVEAHQEEILRQLGRLEAQIGALQERVGALRR